MRAVSSATCTSGEPVSPAARWNCETISALLISVTAIFKPQKTCDRAEVPGRAIGKEKIIHCTAFACMECDLQGNVWRRGYGGAAHYAGKCSGNALESRPPPLCSGDGHAHLELEPLANPCCLRATFCRNRGRRPAVDGMQQHA